MHGKVTLLLVLSGLMLMIGCGADDPTGPTPPPGQAGSQYDGLWTADFAPFNHPFRGMRLEILAGTLVHVYLDSFWDIAQCTPQGFASTRFDPVPPAPVQNGQVTVSGLVAGPFTIDLMTMAFTSATSSKGSLTVSFNQGGPCVADDVRQPFQAGR